MADIEQVSQVIDLIAMSMCKPRFGRLFAYPEEVGDAIRAAMKDTAIRAHILQSAWRPISEVPVRPFDKDKWYLNALRCLGNVSVNGYVDIISYGYTERGKGRWQDSNGRICIPTHFQPLPLPPTGGEHE